MRIFSEFVVVFDDDDDDEGGGGGDDFSVINGFSRSTLNFFVFLNVNFCLSFFDFERVFDELPILGLCSVLIGCNFMVI